MAANWLLQYGATFLPLAFVVMFFAYESLGGWLQKVVACLALVVFGLGMWAFREALKLARKEEQQKQDDRKVTNSLIAEARRDMAAIIGELDEIRRGQHGSDNPKPTDQDNL